MEGCRKFNSIEINDCLNGKCVVLHESIKLFPIILSGLGLGIMKIVF